MSVLSLPTWKSTGSRGSRKGTMGARRRRDRQPVAWWSLLRRFSVTLAKALILGLVLAMLLASMSWVIRRPMFEIRRVMVTGNLQQVDRDLLVKRVKNMHGNFFTLNLGEAAQELQTIPWVRTASFRRLWPDGVEVMVEEQQPMARWGDDGLVNRQGELFEGETTQVLPQMYGPEGSQARMLMELEQFEQELAPINERVDSMELSERGSWTIHLASGFSLLLGRVEAHQRLSRFVSVWAQVFGSNPPHEGWADLRYPKGFALHPDGVAGGAS